MSSDRILPSVMAVILSLPLDPALTKVTVFAVCGLTGVSGSVLLLLSLPLGDDVRSVAVCCCCLGDVAGVKIPKLTRLGRLILTVAPASFNAALAMVALFVGD